MAHLDDVIVVKIWVEGEMSKFRPFACYVYGRWFFSQSWTYMAMYFGPYLSYCPFVCCRILICCSWHIALSIHIICFFVKTSKSCWKLEDKTLNCQRNQTHFQLHVFSAWWQYTSYDARMAGSSPRHEGPSFCQILSSFSFYLILPIISATQIAITLKFSHFVSCN